MTLSCISWQLAVSFHLRGGTASELAQSRVLQAKTRCWPGYVPVVVAGYRRVHDTCLSVFLCVCACLWVFVYELHSLPVLRLLVCAVRLCVPVCVLRMRVACVCVFLCVCACLCVCVCVNSTACQF